jgi:4-alpha-glucanotransferase
VRFPRASGLLLHPTSLPGPFACGDLGPAADAFVDFLAAAGQSLWQVLPLGPTGFGDSPYQCFSAFAGNPLLVSPERLVEDGLLSRHDLSRLPARHALAVDYGAATAGAALLANLLAERLPAHALHGEFVAWRERTPWLADFARFMSLREAHGGARWSDWPAALRAREPGARAEADRALAARRLAHEAMQWAFARQWARLRAHAHARGVAILGDAPIFVAYDSADVWAHPELFALDQAGQPSAVAGVPPDYFSETGQLWGNPLYSWAAHARDDYAWWRARLAALTRVVDRVRLDHFIGFVRHWEVPPTARDARTGRWRPGPGEALFRAIERELGQLPLVAEDLGETDAEVAALRDRLGLPGMRVLQFAFSSGATNPFLPHNHVPNAVVYTGTHDNDTTPGWWASLDEHERGAVRDYLGPSSGDIAWDMIRAGLASVADTFVAPVQDLLSLGSEARFNLPGSGSGHWGWRLEETLPHHPLADRLRRLTSAYGRIPPRD